MKSELGSPPPCSNRCCWPLLGSSPKLRETRSHGLRCTCPSLHLPPPTSYLSTTSAPLIPSRIAPGHISYLPHLNISFLGKRSASPSNIFVTYQSSLDVPCHFPASLISSTSSPLTSRVLCSRAPCQISHLPLRHIPFLANGAHHLTTSPGMHDILLSTLIVGMTRTAQISILDPLCNRFEM